MTRRCDKCQSIISLGTDHIEVRFIGMEKVKALFKVSQLDFCSLKCLVNYWEQQTKI